MVEFKTNDVVIYQHVDGGDPKRNGALGIIERLMKNGSEPIIVRWLSVPYEAREMTTNPIRCNLQIIGHIDE
jgi:hypothetical protein